MKKTLDPKTMRMVSWVSFLVILCIALVLTLLIGGFWP